MEDNNKVSIGNIEVIALQDGKLNLPIEVLRDLDENQTKKLKSKPEENPLTLSNINAFLIKNGNKNLLGLFMGEAMKIAKGKANPKILSDILRKKLNKWN